MLSIVFAPAGATGEPPPWLLDSKWIALKLQEELCDFRAGKARNLMSFPWDWAPNDGIPGGAHVVDGAGCDAIRHRGGLHVRRVASIPLNQAIAS